MILSVIFKKVLLEQGHINSYVVLVAHFYIAQTDLQNLKYY